jgi:hypothetical protein
MAVKYVNRTGQTFYLHEGKTKTGKRKYFLSLKEEGVLAESIPDGYEIYENPDAHVYFRKKVPQLVTNEEIAVVRGGLRRFAPDRQCLVDVRKEYIVVHYSKAGSFYHPVLRFTLIDEEHRKFAVDRWCFLGSIDDWMRLSEGEGELPKLVETYTPHIGKDSFYELM